ncbi:MAG TPA: hypothetical protein VIG06_23290 [Kofleriaceae bacterium]
MLSPAVALHDLDGAHLAGWLDLFLPPGLSAARFAIVFLAPDRTVAHAVASGRGAIDDVPFAGTAPRELAALRRALDVGMVAVLADGAAGSILGDIERALRFDDDYPAQVTSVLRSLKRAAGAGLWLDPPLLDLVPPLSSDALQRTFELLIPAPSALTAYVFDGRTVVASVIAVVEKGDIALVTTHLGLEDALPGPTLARAWRSEYRRALALIDERYAEPSIGLFAERAAIQRVLAGPGDQLATELSAGTIVIDPAPAWLRGLLGGAQLATTAARVLGRFVPPAARRAAEAAQRRFAESGAHPFAVLGFDPIALWRDLRRFYRPPTGGGRGP